MKEAQERLQSYQPMHELAIGLATEMGETADQRVEWLMQQDVSSLGNLLVQINAIARGIASDIHGFDGEGVQAGTMGGSIPPDQGDKVFLLDELLRGSQQHVTEQLQKGETPQTIMHEVAMVVPTVLNKLHLFQDGNGRTSRFMRMVLRDSDQLTPEKTELLISKESVGKYDTTPTRPVENALMTAMRFENGTDKLRVINDAIDDEQVSVVEEELETLIEQYPGLDKSVVKAYEDSFNFNETIRLIAKNDGQDGDISLKDMLGKIADDPVALQQFKQVYRGVRKQRVEFLIDGLLGNKGVLLDTHNKDGVIKRYTSYARKQKNLPKLDPDSIRTAQDLQMAYVEAHSPERFAA